MLGFINDVKIESLATTVSVNRIPVADRVKGLVSEKRVKRLISGTGVEKVSVVDDGVCASDLCVASAKEIFANGLAKKEDIGAVIFVTQRPDYPLPATSYSIQNRLGLSTDVLAFDVNCSCPGFVYGIYIASSMLSNLDKKVLLCCGDVSTAKDIMHPKSTAFLSIMGDAAAAAVIGEAEGRKIYYNIESFGERFKSLYEPRGGARERIKRGPDGNKTIEPENYSMMDGMAILDFTVKDVPKNIKDLLSYTTMSSKDLDIALVHQANGLVVHSLAENIGVTDNVMPFKCAEIGNTDMASIPACMTELKRGGEDYKKYENALLSGFGAGFSVASMIMDISDIHVLPTNEI